MYHVKFFKVPSITKSNGYELKAVLTLTNDLGDQFFFGEADILVTVGKLSQVLKWQPGMQSVNVRLTARQFPDPAVLKAEVVQSTVVDHLNDEEDHRADYFLALYSVPLRLPQSGGTYQGEKYAVRKIGEFNMIEETGHSIAKKVWDGGIITSLSLQGLGIPVKGTNRVLELGTGCGLVGLTVARIFDANVTVTDLEDAQEICEKNLQQARDQRVKFKVLDWENVGTEFKQQPWDLIITTDCTYNETYFEPLMSALEQLATQQTTIVIGHKDRNAAEDGFFQQFPKRFNVELSTRVEMFGESVRVVKASSLK